MRASRQAAAHAPGSMRALAFASVSSILARSKALIGAPIRWRIAAAALASLTAASSRRWQPAHQDSRSSCRGDTALVSELAKGSQRFEERRVRSRIVPGAEIDIRHVCQHLGNTPAIVDLSEGR